MNSHHNVQDKEWACVELEYPIGGEISAIKMKDTVRGFASAVLRNHNLVTIEESDEEQFLDDF